MRVGVVATLLVLLGWPGSGRAWSESPYGVTLIPRTPAPTSGGIALRAAVFGDPTPNVPRVAVHIEDGRAFDGTPRTLAPPPSGAWQPLPVSPVITATGGPAARLVSIAMDRPYYSWGTPNLDGPRFQFGLQLDARARELTTHPDFVVEIVITLVLEDDVGRSRRTQWIVALPRNAPPNVIIERAYDLAAEASRERLLVPGHTVTRVDVEARWRKVGINRVTAFPGKSSAVGGFVVGPPLTTLLGLADFNTTRATGTFETMVVVVPAEPSESTARPFPEIHFVDLASGQARVYTTDGAAVLSLRNGVAEAAAAAVHARGEFRDRLNLSDAFPVIPRDGPPIEAPRGPALRSDRSTIDATFSGRVRVQVSRTIDTTLPAGGVLGVESALVPLEGLRVCLFEDDPGSDDVSLGCDETDDGGVWAINRTLRRSEDDLGDPEYYVAFAAERRRGRLGGFLIRPEPVVVLGEVGEDLFGLGETYAMKAHAEEHFTFQQLLDFGLGTGTSDIAIGTSEFILFESMGVAGAPPGPDQPTTPTDALGSILNIFREAFLAQRLWQDTGGPELATFDGEDDFVRINWPIGTARAFGRSSFFTPFNPYPDALDLSWIIGRTLVRMFDPEVFAAVLLTLLLEVTDLVAGAAGGMPIDLIRSPRDVTTDPTVAEEFQIQAILDGIDSTDKNDNIAIFANNLFVERSDTVRHEYGHAIQNHTQGAVPIEGSFASPHTWANFALCSRHRDGVPNSQQCAFGEGFADFWSAVSEGDPFGEPRVRATTEFANNQGVEVGLNCGRRVPACPPASPADLAVTPSGGYYEDRVAAALLDIVDGRTDLEIAGSAEDETIARSGVAYNPLAPWGAQGFGDWNGVVPRHELRRIVAVLDEMRMVSGERTAIRNDRMHRTTLRSITEFIHAAAGRATERHEAEPMVFLDERDARGALLAARWNFVFVDVSDERAGCHLRRNDIDVYETVTVVDDVADEPRRLGALAGRIVLPSRIPVLTGRRLPVAQSQSVPTCWVAYRDDLAGAGATMFTGAEGVYVGLPFAGVGLENELGYGSEGPRAEFAGAVVRIRALPEAMASGRYVFNPAVDAAILPSDLNPDHPLLPPANAFFGATVAAGDFDRDGSEDLVAGTLATASSTPSFAVFVPGAFPPPPPGPIPTTASSELAPNQASVVDLREWSARADAAFPLATGATDHVPRQLVPWLMNTADSPRLVTVMGNRAAVFGQGGGFARGSPGARFISWPVRTVDNVGSPSVPLLDLGGVLGSGDVDTTGDGRPDLVLPRELLSFDGDDELAAVEASGDETTGDVGICLRPFFLECRTLTRDLLVPRAPPPGSPTPSNAPTTIMAALGFDFGVLTRSTPLVARLYTGFDSARPGERIPIRTVLVNVSENEYAARALGPAPEHLNQFQPRSAGSAAEDQSLATSSDSPLALGLPDRLHDTVFFRVNVAGRGDFPEPPEEAVAFITNAALLLPGTAADPGEVIAFATPRLGSTGAAGVVTPVLRPPTIPGEVTDDPSFGWSVVLAPHPRTTSATAFSWWIAQPMATSDGVAGAGVIWVRELMR